jgi:hypothetical protein
LLGESAFVVGCCWRSLSGCSAQVDR